MLGRTLSRGYRALRPLPSSSVYLRRSTLPTRAFSGTARACAEPVKPESHTGNKGYETVQPKATPKPPLSWYFSDFTTLDYAAFAGFFVMMGIIFYEAWPQSKRPEDFDGKEHLSKVYKPRSTSFITPDQPGKAHYDPPGYDIVNRTVPGQTARQQESQEDSEPESEPEPEADSKPEPTPEPEPVPPKPTVSEVTPIVNAAPVSQKPSKPIHAKYVLVGGGAATFAAVQAIQNKDPKADILIISKESNPPYMRPPLSKELWFSGDEKMVENLSFTDWTGRKRSLLFQQAEFYQSQNVEEPHPGKVRLVMGVEGSKLDVGRQSLTLSDGRIVTYDRLLLATGGDPRRLPFMDNLGEDLASKFKTFRTIEDFQSLNKSGVSGKHIAIIGGGFLGSELACALANRDGVKVTQIFQEDGNMGHVFPRYLSNWTSSRLRRLGVDIIPKATVVAAESSADGKVTLKTEDGRSVTVDETIVAVGINPNTKLAASAGLEIDEKRGGILVNAELEARANIYAAGDVSSYHDTVLGRCRVEHHEHAIVSGTIAGENMVGARKPYNELSMFWSDLGPEIGYEAVGVIDSNLSTVGVWAKAKPSDTPAIAASQGENIRSHMEDPVKIQQLQNAVSTSHPTSGSDAAPASDEYGKGVVFYVRDKKVVGILLWNVFNEINRARAILREGKTVDDIDELASIFKLHE